MPVEALLAALEADTADAIAAIRATAQDEAARWSAEEALARDARAVEQEHALGIAVDRELEPYREAARRAVLGARHRLVDRVLALASDMLAEAEAAPQHRDALTRTLRAALECVPGPAVVRCRPAVAPLVIEVAAGRPVRIEADPDAPPGLVVRAEDGSVSVDATLEGLLADLRPAFAREILAAVGAAP